MQGIDMKKTGQKIREACKSRNISVKDIQQNLFIGSFQAVYAWFSGKSLPSLDNLYRLSQLLNVSMDSLIVGQQDKYYDYRIYGEISVIYELESKKIPERISLYYTKLTGRAA